ncbi:MAG: uroporphyrinogen-III C-methyltransferase [Phycisphaerae bacterium]
MPPAMVALVGAGPGDPGLITQAGIDLLARADAVLYDRLSPDALLDHCRPGCERIYVGKRPDGPSISQEEIIELLIAHGRPGRLVVRLKGGDPLVFGRGGEEADALAGAGIAVRIVPGITAALAAGACAGIPLTDRRVGPSLAIVTGHEDPAKSEPQLDYGALARLDTVVFYMGVGRLEQIVAALIEAGRDGKTPAAMVEQASTPEQRVVTARLSEMPAAARAATIRPPALLIVGQSVSLRAGVEWSSRLPLSGRTVLVTRSRTQASRLSAGLGLWGARVIEAATISIQALSDQAELDACLQRLSEFDWLVLTSPNGAEALAGRLDALELDARALGGLQIAAIGSATGAGLKKMGLRADLVPEQYTTEALSEALTGRIERGQRVLMLRSDIAPDSLAEVLRSAGAEVADVAAYRTCRPAALPAEALEALGDGRVDWITFTSSSTVENFLSLASQAELSGIKFASIGPVTSATLRAAGLEPTVEASPHTIDALLAGILSTTGSPRNRP